MQLTDTHSVATPVNWEYGDECVIIPSLSDEEADKKFKKGYKTIKPYLRLTPMPSQE